MPVTNVKTDWVDGNLVFYDKSGNIILTYDGTNRKLSFPSGSALDVESGGALKLGGTQISTTATEMNKLAGVTAGTVTASKAVVAGANKNVDVLAVADLKLGAGAGTSVTATAAEVNALAGVAAGTATASKAAVLGANKNLDTIAIADGGLKLGAGAGTAVTATAAEVNAAADLSVNGALVRVKKLSIAATPTGAEQDTAFDLPTKAAVMDVFVDVTTAEATGTTKTLDIGTAVGEGGDADGFLDGIDVSSTGLKRGAFIATADANNTYVGAASTHTIGALLSFLIAGENVAAGGDGVACRQPDVASGGKSVVYTAGSADWAEFRGDIYIVYMEIG